MSSSRPNSLVFHAACCFSDIMGRCASMRVATSITLASQHQSALGPENCWALTCNDENRTTEPQEAKSSRVSVSICNGDNRVRCTGSTPNGEDSMAEPQRARPSPCSRPTRKGEGRWTEPQWTRPYTAHSILSWFQYLKKLNTKISKKTDCFISAVVCQ
jgi:hypothetical protein